MGRGRGKGPTVMESDHLTVCQTVRLSVRSSAIHVSRTGLQCRVLLGFLHKTSLSVSASVLAQLHTKTTVLHRVVRKQASATPHDSCEIIVE